MIHFTPNCYIIIKYLSSTTTIHNCYLIITYVTATINIKLIYNEDTYPLNLYIYKKPCNSPLGHFLSWMCKSQGQRFDVKTLECFPFFYAFELARLLECES
jgi:hypothetical protein